MWSGEILVSHSLPGSRRRPWRDGAGRRHGLNRKPGEGLAGLLEAYFSGTRVRFDAEKLPLDTSGWSSFEADVARALARIPHGTLVSYAHLARLSGYPRAQRAVGNFLAKNPYPVILPCHRVIRSDGRLGNFSSGAGWKKRLIELERRTGYKQPGQTADRSFRNFRSLG